MDQIPAVLLVDDGELDDVRALIDEIGVECRHLRGGRIPQRLHAPVKLFVCTTRRATLAQPWPSGSAGPTRICVVTEDSNTARAMLRRMGFDYLVRRPVHPYALRLLLLRALYGGEERRRGLRVAVGSQTSYRIGLRRREATLAELSRRGCRLLSREPLALGTRLSVQLPAAILDGRSQWLRARVVRVDDADGDHVAGLLFEKTKPGQDAAICAALKRLSAGPLPTGRPETGPQETPPDAVAGLPRAAAASVDERRKQERARYEAEVLHLDDEAGRVLVGRDISAGGMRVEANQELRVGASLRLAIYGAPREAPFMLRARVVSNDGAAGVGLQFENLEPGLAKRIEGLVARLPAVEPLQGGEGDAHGTVVGRVLAELPE